MSASDLAGDLITRIREMKGTVDLCQQMCPVVQAKMTGYTTTIKHLTEGFVWSVGADQALGRNGTPVKWTILSLPTLFRASEGRVAIADSANPTRSARHSGYVMWLHPTEGATSPVAHDFVFCFVPVPGSPNTYFIGNDYGDGSLGTKSWVGYASNSGRILIVPQAQRAAWVLDGPLPDSLTRPQFPN